MSRPHERPNVSRERRPRHVRSRAGGLPEEVQALAPIFRAELQAYQGKYQDAARAFAKAGEPQKAIDLFAVLTRRPFPMASTRCRRSRRHATDVAA